MALSAARGRLVETATQVFSDYGISATCGATSVARPGGSKPALDAHFRAKLDRAVAPPLARRAGPRSL